ncbi:mycothiol synthase [Corynebacterium urinipleomorphum]|uniref:mycothiol synthase n=1 Tax=Corynebacterium urinipleomorphum TaxID=1852380 RepID=UPI000B359C89|nr:mycothiol synthase [Corynebacterium urinipleomorphum]
MTQGLSGVQRVDLTSESPLLNAVRGILDRAHTTDGVEALSEGFTKELGRASDHVHWALLIDGAPISLAACAPDGSAELVVDPAERRNGHGTQIAEVVLDERPTAGLWAHGNLPAAQALAKKLSLSPTRELLVMAIEGSAMEAVSGTGAAAEVLGDGFVELSYTDSVERWGREAVEHAWLDVNNDAFSWHPEQGGWTLDALRDAMDTSWFDPAGVRFLWAGGADASSQLPELAGFHWTKRHSAEMGEVYVVGLSSDFRGRGLGDPLMRAGLEHLAAGGSRRVILYVEADNGPAVRRYESMGFKVAEKHVVYSARGDETADA